jgi:hypothetical protein
VSLNVESLKVKMLKAPCWVLFLLEEGLKSEVSINFIRCLQSFYKSLLIPFIPSIIEIPFVAFKYLLKVVTGTVLPFKII